MNSVVQQPRAGTEDGSPWNRRSLAHSHVWCSRLLVTRSPPDCDHSTNMSCFRLALRHPPSMVAGSRPQEPQKEQAEALSPFLHLALEVLQSHFCIAPHSRKHTHTHTRLRQGSPEKQDSYNSSISSGELTTPDLNLNDFCT